MDSRTAKLALARKKLKDHQYKKVKSDTNESTCQDYNRYDGTEVTTVLKVDSENIDIGTDHHPAPSPEFYSKEVSKNKERITDALFEHTATTHNPEVNSMTSSPETDTKITELLVSNKRNLELQIEELHGKIAQLENKLENANTHNNVAKQQITHLEGELSPLKERYIDVCDQLAVRDKVIEESKQFILTLSQEKNCLLEQIEFTKTVLTAKETENANLHVQISNLQNLLEANELRLQQLTNGSVVSNIDNVKTVDNDEKESLVNKVNFLEQQLKFVQKERDQINSQYEHYVSQLNEELKSALQKNEELINKTNDLMTRETGLIEQISSMEIQIQNLRSSKETFYNKSIDDSATNDKKAYDELQEQLKKLQLQNEELNQKLKINQNIISVEAEKSSIEQEALDMNNICISKLNADIENDKIAAQRATEQNKKLKTDLRELEEAFVKMSKDKLEFTEKLDAEKFLNRELTIKLAENVELVKEMQIKLKAKDDEMIRLVSNYRDIENKLEMLTTNHKNDNKDSIHDDETQKFSTISDTEKEEIQANPTAELFIKECHTNHKPEHISNASERLSQLIPKEDAMVKLQERFLKIMGEVADLSDEKHRLEHIIMQLQNETDTICEYVALYQHQRSLLKQRDEERNTQIKLFQTECDRMRSQLDELHEIIVKIIKDTELSTYFGRELKQIEVAKVLDILENMKNNILVNCNNQFADMKNLYPCACCSGNIIDL